MERNTVRTRIRKVYLKYWTESYSDISILIRFIIRFDSDSKKIDERSEKNIILLQLYAGEYTFMMDPVIEVMM